MQAMTLWGRQCFNMIKPAFDGLKLWPWELRELMMEDQPHWRLTESRAAKEKTRARKAKWRAETSRAVTRESIRNLLVANRREKTRAKARTMGSMASLQCEAVEKDLSMGENSLSEVNLKDLKFLEGCCEDSLENLPEGFPEGFS